MLSRARTKGAVRAGMDRVYDLSIDIVAHERRAAGGKGVNAHRRGVGSFTVNYCNGRACKVRGDARR